MYNCLIMIFMFLRIRVTHRDIKPSNILIDQDLIPKLIDLGLSIPLFQLTPSNYIIGTPKYMPLEEIENPQKYPASAYRDVHAIALILFELYTGQNPFAHVSNFPELLDAKRKMEVIPAINWKSDPILRAISVLLNPKNRSVPINKLLRQAYFVIEAQLEKARAEVNQLGGKL